MVLQVPLKPSEHTPAVRVWGTDSHGKAQNGGRVPPIQPVSYAERHKQTQLSSEAWILTNTWISKQIGKGSQPLKPRTTGECYRHHHPNCQWSLVRTNLISNEIREQTGRALMNKKDSAQILLANHFVSEGRYTVLISFQFDREMNMPFCPSAECNHNQKLLLRQLITTLRVSAESCKTPLKFGKFKWFWNNRWIIYLHLPPWAARAEKITVRQFFWQKLKINNSASFCQE